MPAAAVSVHGWGPKPETPFSLDQAGSADSPPSPLGSKARSRSPAPVAARAAPTRDRSRPVRSPSAGIRLRSSPRAKIIPTAPPTKHSTVLTALGRNSQRCRFSSTSRPPAPPALDGLVQSDWNGSEDSTAASISSAGSAISKRRTTRPRASRNRHAADQLSSNSGTK